MKRPLLFSSMLVPFFLICCFLSPHAEAAQTLSHQITPQLMLQAQAGLPIDHARLGDYYPIKLSINNSGKERDLRIRVNGASNYESIVSVPSDELVQHWIYLPVRAQMPSYQNISFHADGNQLGEPLPLYSAMQAVDVQYLRYGNRISTGLKKLTNVLKLSSLSSLQDGSVTTGGLQLIINSGAFSDLPPLWHGLTSIDAIVINKRDWLQNSGKCKVLLDWASMGGCLVLTGPASEMFRQKFEQQLDTHDCPFVIQEAASSKGFNSKILKFKKSGYGRITIHTPTDIPDIRRPSTGGLTPALLSSIITVNRSWSPPRVDYFREFSPNTTIPTIRDIGDLPYLPIFAALIAFVTFVGPVGWWYMVQKKQKGLLFFIVAPAFSVLVSVLIIGISLLKEGITPMISGDIIRMIDQSQHREITVAKQSFYAPLFAPSDIQLPTATIPHFFRKHRNRHRFIPSSESDVNIHPLSEFVSYKGNFLKSRSIVSYAHEGLKRQRRRLSLLMRDKSVVVENQLGATMKDLLVKTSRGYAYIEELAPGKREEIKNDQLTPTLSQKKTKKYVQGIKKRRFNLPLNGKTDAFTLFERFQHHNEFAYIAKQTDSFNKALLGLTKSRDKGLSCSIIGIGNVTHSEQED